MAFRRASGILPLSRFVPIIACVETVFKRICETPELHPIVHNSVRQTLLKRFPYVVCYVFAEDCVDVVAVFHGHRKPTAWQSRMD